MYTIEEHENIKSKYYSYYNIKANHTVIFKGILRDDDDIISDKNFRSYIIIDKYIYNSSGCYLPKNSYKDLKELSPFSNEALWLNACKDADRYLEKLKASEIKTGDYLFINIDGIGQIIGKIKTINNNRISFFDSEFKFDPCTGTYKKRKVTNTWTIYNNNFIRRCSPKEIDIINSKIKIKPTALGYIVVSYEDGDVYMDCTEFNGSTFYFNSAIDIPNDTVYTGNDLANVRYISYSSMTQEEIEWYKECLNQNKILDFPLKKETKENMYINSKDYIEGKYYYSKFKYNNNWYEIIFKYHPDYHKNAFVNITNRRFYYNNCCTSDVQFQGHIRRFATEEEIEWLNICIKHNKYISKEEALKVSEPLKSNDVIQDGYYIFEHKQWNDEGVIKIVNHQDTFEYWAIKLYHGDTITHNICDNSDANERLDLYYHSPAPLALIEWLENCITANEVIPRVKDYHTQTSIWITHNPSIDPFKSLNEPNTPKSIKSEIDDLISIPELEIKTTKIVFINNKN